MIITFDDNLNSELIRHDIFLKDYTSKSPIWQEGGAISFDISSGIEPYVIIMAGNSFISAGSFTGIKSPLTFESRIGRYTEIARSCKLMGARHPVESVSISSALYDFKREQISKYILDYQSKSTEPPLKLRPVPNPQPQRAPIVIGHDVWIGSNVTLNGGITIGNGAVVASNSVVIKDVPPYTLVAGIPAKPKKLRFSQSIIEELEAIKWWDYELGDMFKLGLNFANPIDFIEMFNKNLNNIKKYNPKKFYPFKYFCSVNGIKIPTGALISTYGTFIYVLDGVLRHSVDVMGALLEVNKIDNKIVLFVRNPGLKFIKSIAHTGIVEFSDFPFFFDLENLRNNKYRISSNGISLSVQKVDGIVSMRKKSSQDSEEFALESELI